MWMVIGIKQEGSAIPGSSVRPEKKTWWRPSGQGLALSRASLLTMLLEKKSNSSPWTLLTMRGCHFQGFSLEMSLFPVKDLLNQPCRVIPEIGGNNQDSGALQVWESSDLPSGQFFSPTPFRACLCLVSPGTMVWASNQQVQAWALSPTSSGPIYSLLSFLFTWTLCGIFPRTKEHFFINWVHT